MDKEQFKAFMEENRHRFISGVHNYCDRWCERCPLTDYCSVYAIEKEMAPVDVEDPEQREQFWESISNMLKISGELVQEKAEELGVDLDEISLQADHEKGERILEELQNDPLSQEIRAYLNDSDAWLDRHRPETEEHREKLVSFESYDRAESDLDADQRSIGDLLEVIHWYTPMIYAKTERALWGINEELFEEEESVQNDHNGSAKVALIGVDRLMGAWTGMLIYFRNYEDEVLNLLIRLEKIKKGILTHFPDAPKFKRPGFD